MCVCAVNATAIKWRVVYGDPITYQQDVAETQQTPLETSSTPAEEPTVAEQEASSDTPFSSGVASAEAQSLDSTLPAAAKEAASDEQTCSADASSLPVADQQEAEAGQPPSKSEESLDAPHEKEQKNIEEPVVESNQESVVESKPEAEVESKLEPMVESKPEPVVESKPEPVVESKPEPVVESKPEPVVESKPEPVVESKPEPVVESNPEPFVEKPSTVSKEKPADATIGVVAVEVGEVDRPASCMPTPCILSEILGLSILPANALFLIYSSRHQLLSLPQ